MTFGFIRTMACVANCILWLSGFKLFKWNILSKLGNNLHFFFTLDRFLTDNYCQQIFWAL